MPDLAAMMEAIEKLVRDLDHVSFVEMGKQIEGFRGEYGIEMTPNVFLWQGVSEIASEALIALAQAKRIHFEPVRRIVGGGMPLVYLVDGGFLALPLAKRLTPEGYRKPRWLPVVVRLGPGKP